MNDIIKFFSDEITSRAKLLSKKQHNDEWASTAIIPFFTNVKILPQVFSTFYDLTWDAVYGFSATVNIMVKPPNKYGDAMPLLHSLLIDKVYYYPHQHNDEYNEGDYSYLFELEFTEMTAIESSDFVWPVIVGRFTETNPCLCVVRKEYSGYYEPLQIDPEYRQV